ncbi:flagellar hook-length control protein FliK [Specibacter cremeus]|uniref:flagellar hook-length control protein FliK n=1 Tax=Specibacter cremeus TaxID=1629051 RepID=UPI000F79035D|nr:flagellar hook-length control protein FliK [Specibacter cremeus]
MPAAGPAAGNPQAVSLGIDGAGIDGACIDGARGAAAATGAVTAATGQPVTDAVPAALADQADKPAAGTANGAPAHDPAIGANRAADPAANPVLAPSGPAAATSVVVPSPAAATTPPPTTQPVPTLVDQLAKPLFTLSGAPEGRHVMTVEVVPDALGPVTVRAHIGADGIRIELLSGTDAGRDGLRAILADLRRDLAGQGMNSSLSLGSGTSGDPGRPGGWTAGGWNPGGSNPGGWNPGQGSGRESGRDADGPYRAPGPDPAPARGAAGTRTGSTLDITV